MLAALPDAFVVSAADDAPGAGRMHMLMSAMQEELEDARGGAEAIATDLASASYVMVMHADLHREGNGSGLLGLLAHRQLGRAVAAMLDDPARNGSLDELTTCANVSRASPVRMFRRTAQRPPLAVLAELRLELARRKLSGPASPVAAIAAEVGCPSESAFSRTFSRQFAVRPGEVCANAAA